MQYSDRESLLGIVASRLHDSLPHAALEMSVFAEQQFVILKSEPTLAGFSVGLNRHDYLASYDAFKQLFAKRRSEWSGLDLSFAFCYQSESMGDDAFASSIETDVFFCRKFALEISAEDTSALNRLPFLPLLAVTEGGSRPPSAQTLLQRSGVSPELARALVVPGNRSAERIVEDGYRSGVGSIESSHEPEDSPLVEEVNQEFIRLTSMTVTNFRAYRKAATFEFGAGVTVLYGPNGFGKTSLFDALDFVATGGIGRLQVEHNSANLQKAARHLDSGDESSKVVLEFFRGNTKHTLSRDLTKPGSATLDGREGVTRKEVLTLLTGSEDSPIADRVDNLVSLFRATHTFNQESSELTQGFAQTCQLSADLVSRMLAFDDYVRAIKKVDEVNKTLGSRLRKDTDELTREQDRLKTLEFEIARVENLTNANIDPQQLTNELVKARQELASLSGIAVQSGQFDVADPRSMRSEADRIAKSLELRVARLTEALSSLSRYRTALMERESLTTRLHDLQLRDSELASKKNNLEQSHSHNISVLAASRTEESNVQSRLVSLQALSPRVITRSSALARRPTLLRSAEVAEREVSAAGTRLAERASQLAILKERERALAKSVVGLRSRLADVETLKDALSAYELSKQRASDLSGVEKSLGTEEVELHAAIEESSERLRVAEAKAASSKSSLEAVETERSQVEGLLVALRVHIHDDTCLLCGVRHESADELLRRVDARLGDDLILKTLNSELTSAKSELVVIAQEHARLSARLVGLRARVTSLQADRRYNDTQLEEVRSRFSAAGLSDSESDLLAAESSFRQRIDAEEALYAQVVLESQECETNVGSLESEVRVKSAARETIAAELLALAALDSEFRRLAGEAGLSADLDEVGVSDAVAKAISEIAEIGMAIEIATAKYVESSIEVEKVNGSIGESRRSIDQMLVEASELTERVRPLEAQILAAGLELVSQDSEVLTLIERATSDIAEISKIRDRLVSIEHALESLATSAVLETSLAERKKAKERVAVLTSEIQKAQTLRRYFDELARMLENRRNSATRDFTEQYGPRTAVIQRRLRPVYGFGDIDVSSRNGAISVEVMRNGEPYKPTDYFSQSQVQTLILGLFLTAAGSQSWSSCASILMDDPVSHFDDLNTYALIDLLSGLINSSVDARQFIVSTCDEKFLQIARHKFQHLDKRARLYKFHSIGQSGPEVTELAQTKSSSPAQLDS